MGIRIQRATALALSTLCCVSVFAGCGKKAEQPEPAQEPDSFIGETLQETGQEGIGLYDTESQTPEILSKDVLAFAGTMTKVKNIAEQYTSVPAQYLSEMAAWESVTADEDVQKAKTYVFIGQISDMNYTQDVINGLFNSTENLPGVSENADDYQREVAVQGKYVICATAPNGGDIVSKFAALLADESADIGEDIDSIFENL